MRRSVDHLVGQVPGKGIGGDGKSSRDQHTVRNFLGVLCVSKLLVSVLNMSDTSISVLFFVVLGLGLGWCNG